MSVRRQHGLTGDIKVLTYDDKYIITNTSIKDIKDGDKVVTYKYKHQSCLSHTSRNANHCAAKMAEELLELTFSNGVTLKCTPDCSILKFTGMKDDIYGPDYDEDDIDDRGTCVDEYTGQVQAEMCDAGKLTVGDYVYYAYDDDTEYTIKAYHEYGECDHDLVKLVSIQHLDPEMVYAFETGLDTHTLVANGLIISDCAQTL